MNIETHPSARPRGFTLVELVVVIVIVGILSALGGLIITSHMEGYADMRQRAELVDSAESALRRMQREIRAALPNSVRIRESGSYEILTFLHAAAGGRYRARSPFNATGFDPERLLEFEEKDDRFAMLGRLFTNSSGEVPSRIRNGTVVVYNTGQPPLDASSPSPNNKSPIQGIDNATGPSPLFRIKDKRFPYASPFRRFQVIDSQIRYVWNKDLATLKRYELPARNMTDPESTSPSQWGDGALVSRHTAGADFIYRPGTHSRSGLTTLRLTLKEAGESVSLLHQVHVLNFP